MFRNVFLLQYRRLVLPDDQPKSTGNSLESTNSVQFILSFLVALNADIISGKENYFKIRVPREFEALIYTGHAATLVTTQISKLKKLKLNFNLHPHYIKHLSCLAVRKIV